MRKKYLSALLFGTMIAVSTGTFTSCKDYDDEISNLQEQVDAIKASVADLESKIQSGNWVTSLKDVDGGFEITFNDGSKYTIVNGETGATGAAGTQWTIENGYWVLDGVPTEYPVTGPKGDKGEQGDKGDAGYSPTINPQTRTWMVWSEEEGKAVDSGIVANTSIYVVESIDKPCYTLYVLEKDTEGNNLSDFAEIILPTSSQIADLKLMNIDNGKIQEGAAELKYYYGAVPSGSDIEFDGDTYEENQTLYSHVTRSVIYAQINPADVNFADPEIGYKFQLLNSHGESSYDIKAFEQYSTENPLSRAAKVNKGIYKLTVGENINTTGDAYALSTKDAYGNEIISAYDLTIASVKVTNQALKDGEVSLDVNKTHNLYDVALDETNNSSVGEYNTLDDVAAYYFTIPNGTNNVELNGDNIKSTKAQTVDVTVHYLTLQGVEKNNTLTINFHTIVDLGTINVALDANIARESAGPTYPEIVKYLNAESVSQIISDNGITATSSETEYDVYYTSSGISGIEYKLIKMKQDDADNELKNGNFYIMATISPESVDDTNHESEFELKSAGVSYAICNLNINVVRNDDIFTYFKKSLWFEEGSWDAVAYGTPNSSKVGVDLFNLFAENVNGTPVEITAIEQEHFKFADKATVDSWTPSAVINNHNLSIANSQMYKTHTLTANYYPWGNENLTPISQEFTLTFKSPFREAEKKQAKEIVFTSLSQEETISNTDFEWIDPRSKEKFSWSSNSEVSSMTLSLSDELFLYVGFGATSKDYANLKDTAAKLKFKQGVTMPVSTIEGIMTLTVTDAWGVKTTQEVKVVLQP